MAELTPPSDLFSVAGKSVVVTGGGRGIGLMIARGFLAAGARVLISSRKAEPLQRAAEELSALGECVAVPADVSTREGVAGLAEQARTWAPELHVLVNNAGATWGAPIDDFPAEGFDKVVGTNLTGVFHLTAELLPSLRAAASADDPARVINIGSIDGLRPPKTAWESYPYTASKAGVHMLTRHLAARLGPEHITVNAIAPGPFETKMLAFALEDEAVYEQLVDTTPLGRIGRPDDIAGTAIFLASAAAAYITGIVVPVDGGRSGCA